ncbi:MAG: ribosome hibernation promotion factor [Acidimicrobiales bacterium]
MPVPADVTTEMSHKGDVPSRSMDTAAAKVTRAAERCREQVRHVEIRLTLESAPGRERPAIAEATIDVEGYPVRAHVAAGTIDEAVDLLVDRLRRRIQRHEEHRHRLADRHRTGDSGPGEWRHGDAHTVRPEFLPLPFDEREVKRQKTFAMTPMTIEEALFDLEQLGHDFYLFVEFDSGRDCVVRRNGEGAELASEDPTELNGETPEGVSVDPAPAPVLDLVAAKEHLEATGERHLFFRAVETDRSQVLYRRYDGHYGLVTST